VDARLAGMLLVLGGGSDEAKVEIFDYGFSEFQEGVFADMPKTFVPVCNGKFLWCNTCE